MNKILKDFKNIKYGPAPEDDSEVLAWIKNFKSSNKNYIDGKWISIKNSKKISVINPANKKKLFNLSISGKKDIDTAVSAELRKADCQLVCLAGFMRILSEQFINNWPMKIINIHPSLLPSFKGRNVQKQAIDAGVRITGCTVHFVNSKLDSGKIINQKKVKIKKFDTPKSLAKRILIQEHKLYPAAIKKILSL